MKAFRFNLAAALRLREREEQTQTQALGLAQGRLASARRDLDSWRDRHHQSEQDFAQARRAPLPAEAVHQYRHHADFLRRRLTFAEQTRALAQEEVAQRRETWQQARRARQVLERLRDQHYARWQTECRRVEDRELEEAARRRSQAL
ncbi:MAG TPA: flagellar export protein FliJ [Armatimonadota bacterium]|jgi:flagellar export protein FliJ